MPVILVAGDEALMREVSPDIEKLALKSAVSRYAAKSKSLRMIRKDLTYACAKALERFRMGAIKPMKIKEPIKIEMRFTRTESADCAELLPAAKRIDGKTIEFESRDILEGYRTMELLIFAIYGGRQ